MHYYPPHEDVAFKYAVKVRPPPADSGNVRFLRHEQTGAVLDEQPLELQGSGHPLSMSLSGRTVEDSPIWVELQWKKADTSPETTTLYQVVSLALPGVLTIEVPEDVKPGESVEAKVVQWAALAYDLPGEVTTFEEEDPSRILPDAKSGVCWSVEGTELSSKGETATIQTTGDQAGKTLVLEAWIDDQDPRAKTEVKVPKLEILDGSKAPPDTLVAGKSATWSAVSTPGVEGTYSWEVFAGPADKLQFTYESDSAVVDVLGLGILAIDETLTVKCTLTSAATGNTFEAEHTLRVGGLKIKIRLEDDDGKLADTPYTLEVDDQTFAGTTDGEGYLLAEVSASAQKGTLKFTVDGDEYEFPIHVKDHAVKE